LWGRDEWSGCVQATVCRFDFSDERAAYILDGGWSAPEAWGIWSQETEVSLRIYIDNVQDYELQLQGFPVETAEMCEQGITLWLNGEMVSQTSTTECGSQNFLLQLPAEQLTDGINEFRFGFSHTVSPSESTDGLSGDRRQLGVGFQSLELTPQP
jgi:hypothetical protein